MKVSKQSGFLEGTMSKSPSRVGLSIGTWLINLSYNMVEIASLVGDIFKGSVVMWQPKEVVYILLELLKEEVEKNANSQVKTKRGGGVNESL
jgi:hypothetical protein